MRRSAAPSFQSAKRLKFLSNSVNPELQLKKENDLFELENSGSESIISCSELIRQQPEKSLTVGGENANNVEHTTEELLELLLKPVHQETESDESNVQMSNSAQNTSDAVLVNQEMSEKQNFLQHNTGTSQKQTDENEKYVLDDSSNHSGSNKLDMYYNVLWCKRSAKKHKIWEGDGTLIIKGRSAVLKDPDGKIIDRGMGYKIKEVESLEDGSKFFIGGKECEIQYLMSAEEYKNLSLTDTSENKPPDESSGPKRINYCM